jgi:hypothetical protein
MPGKQDYADQKYLKNIRIVEIQGTNLAQLTLDHQMPIVRKFVGGATNLKANIHLLQVMECWLPSTHRTN